MTFGEQLLKQAEAKLRAFNLGVPLTLDPKVDQKLIDCINSDELYERILHS